MKPISLFFAGAMLLLASCSEEIDNTTTGSTTEPGTYIVGVNLNMEVPLTKGINYGENANFSFDSEYTPDTIYLHHEGKSIVIPVSEKTEECGDGCKGFAYKICTVDGQTTITPLNENGEESGKGLQISGKENFYFSSSSEDVWKATTAEGTSVPHDPEATLYTRTDVELYRSTKDFSIDDLKNEGQLDMKRVCCGFTFFCAFTDRVNKDELTIDEFEAEMGFPYKDYSIQVYIGGPAFTNEYDISIPQGEETNTNGYYASGDAKTGIMGPVPLREGINSSKGNGVGIGYATLENNELITPIIDGATINAYIYITHKSTNTTIYTEVVTDGLFRGGNFYRVGADIDIKELAAAFKEYEGEPADTRSTSAPRLFTPKSLVTHIEY